MKVLIVDDSATMRRILKTQLASIGATTILEAQNGEEALRVLSESMPVDIVTLDVNMPVMDGMSALRAIRKDPRYTGVKIVMVTSESEKERVVEAIAAGANNYVVKPFTPDTLKVKLGL
jgi:two-component system, chemotaxis family, chemotaxis protein CheY